MNVLDYFEDRFGIAKENFAAFELYKGPKGKIYLGPKDLIQKPDIASLGLLIARAHGTIKPTSNFLQMFGHKASKNIINLSKMEAAAYAKGDDLKVESVGASDGYVLLRYSNCSLGCGLLKGNIITNLLPKAKRQELKYL